jgi:NAD(P)-dependent dehydrogenase (short-subunit alcohol dehydrogenase family)
MEKEMPGLMLAGRKILVVGGGQIPEDGDPPANGHAITLAAATEGATVCVADKSAEAAAATAMQVRQNGGTAFEHIADISDPPQVANMIERAAACMEGLDGLVLNVGFGSGLGIAETTHEDWDMVFSVNVRAHMLACKAALPLMPVGASIVFISSVGGRRFVNRYLSYASSKAAVEGLARSIAAEGEERGIRANVAVLGFIDTPIGRRANSKIPGRAQRSLPFGRQGRAEECANAVVFLLSDRASYVNAHCLVVDGGWSVLR